MPIDSEAELRRLVEEDGWGVYYRKDKERWYAYKRMKDKTTTQLVSKDLDWIAGELSAAMKKKSEKVPDKDLVKRFMDLDEEAKKKVVSWGTFVRDHVSTLVPEENISTYLIEAMDLYGEHRLDLETLDREFVEYRISLDTLKEKFERIVKRLEEILGFAAFVRSSLKLGLISQDAALNMLMSKIFEGRTIMKEEEESE